MRIASLNVNNFCGAKGKKTNWDEYKKIGASRQKYECHLEASRQNPAWTNNANAIAERLNNPNLVPNIVVLSEFDISTPAGEAFIQRFADYELVVPIGETNGGKILEKAEEYGPTYSITVILIKKDLYREEIRREMAPGGWADFNLVKLDDLTVLGVHAKERNFDALKKWAMESDGDTEKILVVGDFNTYEENEKCPETRDAYKKLLEKGYMDLCPEGVPTYIGRTCIDHALVSPALGRLAKEGEVVRSFIDDRLTDHAAVIIDLDL